MPRIITALMGKLLLHHSIGKNFRHPAISLAFDTDMANARIAQVRRGDQDSSARQFCEYLGAIGSSILRIDVKNDSHFRSRELHCLNMHGIADKFYSLAVTGQRVVSRARCVAWVNRAIQAWHNFSFAIKRAKLS
ncbi:hypothetical protein BK634_13290 [Pseudomonas chlororaphis]|nr:hypothetical protein BK634_13290 [Pseudomonas chlororaphis]